MQAIVPVSASSVTAAASFEAFCASRSIRPTDLTKAKAHLKRLVDERDSADSVKTAALWLRNQGYGYWAG